MEPCVWSDNGQSDSLTDFDLYHRSLDVASGTWSEIDVVVDSDVIDAAPDFEFDTDGRLHIVFVRSDYTSDPLSVDIYHTVNSGIAQSHTTQGKRPCRRWTFLQSPISSSPKMALCISLGRIRARLPPPLQRGR